MSMLFGELFIIINETIHLNPTQVYRLKFTDFIDDIQANLKKRFFASCFSLFSVDKIGGVWYNISIIHNAGRSEQ